MGERGAIPKTRDLGQGSSPALHVGNVPTCGTLPSIKLESGPTISDFRYTLESGTII